MTFSRDLSQSNPSVGADLLLLRLLPHDLLLLRPARRLRLLRQVARVQRRLLLRMLLLRLRLHRLLLGMSLSLGLSLGMSLGLLLPLLLPHRRLLRRPQKMILLRRAGLLRRALRRALRRTLRRALRRMLRRVLRRRAERLALAAAPADRGGRELERDPVDDVEHDMRRYTLPRDTPHALC